MAKKNRSAQDIRADMEKAGGDGKKLKTLREELSATLGAGAEACEDCGNVPHAMQKRAAVEGADPRPALYEVGCLHCRAPKRARGFSPEEAVRKWNAGELVTEG